MMVKRSASKKETLLKHILTIDFLLFSLAYVLLKCCYFIIF
jgi:hypothetical protein